MGSILYVVMFIINSIIYNYWSAFCFMFSLYGMVSGWVKFRVDCGRGGYWLG